MRSQGWFHEYGDKCTAAAGKIGYARKYVQAFAQHFELRTIYMLDDNVPEVFEVATEKGDDGKRYITQHQHPDSRKNKVDLKNVPLYHVLKHLEGLHDGKAKAPRNQLQLERRVDYTGSPDKYGVIGIEKCCAFTETRIKKPFKNTHVYKVSLINISALKSKHIEYKPWEVWEDLRLNDDCDQAGLFVVKFNRFAARVRNWSTWQPALFIWGEKTTLDMACDKKPVPAGDESNLLLKYIKDWALPGRCEDDLSNDQRPEEMAQLVKIIEKLSWPGRHHFAAVHPTSLNAYLRKTRGLSSFEKHILILSKKSCCENNWKTVNDFSKNVIIPNFVSVEGGVPEFRIGNSHNVTEYDVTIVLVYIEGKSKYTLVRYYLLGSRIGSSDNNLCC